MTVPNHSLGPSGCPRQDQRILIAIFLGNVQFTRQAVRRPHDRSCAFANIRPLTEELMWKFKFFGYGIIENDPSIIKSVLLHQIGYQMDLPAAGRPEPKVSSSYCLVRKVVSVWADTADKRLPIVRYKNSARNNHQRRANTASKRFHLARSLNCRRNPNLARKGRGSTQMCPNDPGRRRRSPL